MAYFDESSFRLVMDRSAVVAGISDYTARIVALLYGVRKTNPRLIDALLDPDRVSIETRTVQLPLAGGVELAVIRLDRSGAARSMDLLEHAVRAAESFMTVPFPTTYVALLFADAVTRDFAGTNFGTHMAVLPEYDVDDDSHEAWRAGSLIAHEVAHYYWAGNTAWIDEGASVFMEAVAENLRTGSPLEPTHPPCGHASSIARLEELGASGYYVDRTHPAFICNYSLGERLFMDLFRELGEVEFRRAFARLYEASTEGTALGIAEVREAFPTARSVISRWYDGG